MKALIVLTSAISLTGIVASAEVDVYLLAGQSNMQGVGKIANLKEEQKQSPKNTYFWANGAFEPLVIGKTKISARPANFGPEVGFSSVMSKSGKPIYIIKYYASGMPLHHGWNGNKWLGGQPTPNRTNFYPGKNAQDPNQGKLYKAMNARFQAGLKALKAQGHTPVVKGFLWMQGEQDSKNEVSATSYATSLKQLRNRVAQDLASPDLPMVFGQVLPYEKAMPRFTHRREIRSQMAAADMSSGKPEAIHRCAMVSTDTFPLLKDTVHYNTQGQWMLGQAMAEGIMHAQNSGAKLNIWEGKVIPGFPKDFEHKPYTQVDPERISDTSSSFMRVYPADPAKATGTGLVIFPGGAYTILADKMEGGRVAAYYAKHGISCFVVKYRVTRGKNNKPYMFPGPLYDARQAIRLIKENAKAWNVNPDKIGVMGFSAGGHLAGMCVTRYNDKIEGEPPSETSVKPAFGCLIYPVVSLVEKYSHGWSRYKLFGKSPKQEDLIAASPEKRVTKDTPPIFMAANQFDSVQAENVLNLALACKKQKAPCELHLYPHKDHGFGMGRLGDTEEKNPAIAWPELCLKFILRQ